KRHPTDRRSRGSRAGPRARANFAEAALLAALRQQEIHQPLWLRWLSFDELLAQQDEKRVIRAAGRPLLSLGIAAVGAAQPLQLVGDGGPPVSPGLRKNIDSSSRIQQHAAV